MVIHVVNKGELLWQIADYYQIDINEIIKVNELSSQNLLLVGQALLIPITDILYTVSYGDTLWSITNRFGVPLQSLLSLNRMINTNLIYPGVVLTIPQRPKPGIEVNAYTYVFGINDIPVLEDTIDYLTYLTPFSYLVREDGRLISINDYKAIQISNSNNVMPMMAIANFSYNNRGEVVAHAVLNSTEIIETLLYNIINIMKDKGYRGLYVDFENILPEDSEAYNNFLQMAASILHKEGLFITTALAPKYNEEQKGLLYEAHDYVAHGKIVDFIILMTCERGWRAGSPKAVSPINKIRRVLDYAASLIPKDKIFMGFQIYAKDWVIPHIEGQEAESFSMQEAMNRAYRYRVRIQYDEVSQSPFFHYTDEQGRTHEVWFEDARSAQAKFDLVKEYGLRGITYCALGYPFPQNWYLLKDNFKIIKE